MSLVPIQRTICLELMLEYTHAIHHIDSRWPWYQVLCVGHQGLVLLFHSSTPVGLTSALQIEVRMGDSGEAQRRDANCPQAWLS
jgi:hypothetical protein